MCYLGCQLSLFQGEMLINTTKLLLLIAGTNSFLLRFLNSVVGQETLFSQFFFQPDVQIGTYEVDTWGNRAMDWYPIRGELEILLVASCYGNQS